MSNTEIMTILRAHPELIPQVLEILTHGKQKPSPAGCEKGAVNE